MVSQKVRNNASISYFFLGWIFLLAKNNPVFSDPFIRTHAKNATKGHLFFFISYFLYSSFVSEFFTYSLPVIQITINHVIEMVFFILLTLFIIHGAYIGQKGGTGEDGESSRGEFSLGESSFGFSGASEAERITFLLSYIPFLGMIVASKKKHSITATGGRVSSIF